MSARQLEERAQAIGNVSRQLKKLLVKKPVQLLLANYQHVTRYYQPNVLFIGGRKVFLLR